MLRVFVAEDKYERRSPRDAPLRIAAAESRLCARHHSRCKKSGFDFLLVFKWPFVDAKPSSECPADPAVERRFIAEAGSTLLHRTEPAVATARLL
jgi:hypothetical protein